MATFLLEHGANVNALGSNSGGNPAETPLSLAVNAGDERLVDVLLARGGDVNPELRHDKSPLAIALDNGDYGFARRLLAKGAHLKGEASAFDFALQNDLAALEKAKATLGEDNREGEGIFHYAALFGTPATLDFLEKSDARQGPTKRGQTPIFWAVRAGNLPAVKWFLKHGANASATDSAGQNLLHVAAFTGSPELGATLLAAKADPKAVLPDGSYAVLTSGRGVTPLHRAALYGNLPMMKALLAAKADPNAPTEAKMTPLNFAAMSGQTKAVQLLLQSGADAKSGPPLLLSAARDFSFSMRWGHPTPLPFPTMDKAGTVAAVLAAGADAKAVDSDGRNALFAAVGPMSTFEQPEEERFSAVGALWERQTSGAERAHLIAALAKGGVEVNARPKVDVNRVYGLNWSLAEGTPGPSPLHVAVANLDVAAVKALLENGADARLEDGVGRTPMDLALRRGENSPQRVDVPFANWRGRAFRERDKAAPLLLDGSARRDIIALLRQTGGNVIGRGPFFNAIGWGATKWVKATLAAQPALIKALANYFPHDSAVTINYNPETVAFSAANVALLTNHPELARDLLERGAPFETPGSQNPDMLSAAEKRDWKTVDLLLRLGAKWEADTYAGTSLHLAAQFGDLEWARELVKRGVPLDLKNRNGKTALAIATQERKTEMIAFLKEKGATE